MLSIGTHSEAARLTLLALHKRHRTCQTLLLPLHLQMLCSWSPLAQLIALPWLWAPSLHQETLWLPEELGYLSHSSQIQPPASVPGFSLSLAANSVDHWLSGSGVTEIWFTPLGVMGWSLQIWQCLCAATCSYIYVLPKLLDWWDYPHLLECYVGVGVHKCLVLKNGKHADNLESQVRMQSSLLASAHCKWSLKFRWSWHVCTYMRHVMAQQLHDVVKVHCCYVLLQGHLPPTSFTPYLLNLRAAGNTP